MIAATYNLSDVKLSPYNFISSYCNACNIGMKTLPLKLGFYLGRAKKTLALLDQKGWKSSDIIFMMNKLVDELKSLGKPYSFQYITGILLHSNISPKLKSVENNNVLTPELIDWIEKEVKRLAK